MKDADLFSRTLFGDSTLGEQFAGVEPAVIKAYMDRARASSVLTDKEPPGLCLVAAHLLATALVAQKEGYTGATADDCGSGSFPIASETDGGGKRTEYRLPDVGEVGNFLLTTPYGREYLTSEG